MSLLCVLFIIHPVMIMKGKQTCIPLSMWKCISLIVLLVFKCISNSTIGITVVFVEVIIHVVMKGTQTCIPLNHHYCFHPLTKQINYWRLCVPTNHLVINLSNQQQIFPLHLQIISLFSQKYFMLFLKYFFQSLCNSGQHPRPSIW